MIAVMQTDAAWAELLVATTQMIVLLLVLLTFGAHFAEASVQLLSFSDVIIDHASECRLKGRFGFWIDVALRVSLRNSVEQSLARHLLLQLCGSLSQRRICLL